MEPKAYLNLLSREWNLLVELFEACKNGPVDLGSAIQIIDAHKNADMDSQALFDRLVNTGILGQPLSGETLYQLGSLVETIISQLLQEHRLGLSESIQVHIRHLDELSQRLVQASSDYDPDAIASSTKKIWQMTQDIKQQVHNNLQAIRHIVAQAKSQATNKPLRQRYADVIDAWDQYIAPMGEMVEPHSAFDAIIDSAIARMGIAVTKLESAGALMSETDNVRSADKMLHDMRWHILGTFQVARDVLKPLYEVARLNSRVTRGAAMILDDLQKGRVRKVESYAPLPLFRRTRNALLAPNSTLLAYYFGVRDVEERPSPTITAPRAEDRVQRHITPPLNKHAVLRQLKKDLPVDDMLEWAITHYPDYPTSKVLDIVLHTFNQPELDTQHGARKRYETMTHRIEGPIIRVEHTHA